MVCRSSSNGDVACATDRQFERGRHRATITGYKFFNVLPVEQLGWVRDREPGLYALGELAESESRDWPKDPDGSRRAAYRLEQGTRVKRALALSSQGDDATWLADPLAGDADGEWPCGTWASWNPAMD